MRGGIQPYTAMVRGKAGALDDPMIRTQALCLHLPWHRKVAYVDPRVLGMRVPLGSKASLPDAGASRTRHRRAGSTRTFPRTALITLTSLALAGLASQHSLDC